MFEKLGGRKMVAATLTVAVGIGITLLKGDVPSNLLYLLITIFGVFAGTNTLNTAASISLDKKKLETTMEPAVLPSAPQGVPVQDAVLAFQEVVTRVEAGNAQQKELLNEIIKSTQLSQNALSMIAEKVLSR